MLARYSRMDIDYFQTQFIQTGLFPLCLKVMLFSLTRPRNNIISPPNLIDYEDGADNNDSGDGVWTLVMGNGEVKFCIGI